MTGSSRKTKENSLPEVSENGGTVATQFAYSVWKFIFEANCANILGNHKNTDKTGLFAWITAVVICDACKVYMTAGDLKILFGCVASGENRFLFAIGAIGEL